MEHTFFYEFDIGRIWISEQHGSITKLNITEEQTECELSETPVIKKCADELFSYFNGALKAFTVPILLKGTPFQKSVWEALLKVPYGRTASYKQIAKMVGNEKACRAVGGANNKNPIAIIVPCHRVVGFDGKLAGYAGGLDVKKKLLELEKANNS
jgi:methylated-DNA-[protein]-cysteine S-methyltransferase